MEQTGNQRESVRSKLLDELKDRVINRTPDTWTVNLQLSPEKQLSCVPTLTIIVAGETDVEYRFFDAALFRAHADHHRAKLLNRLSGRSDFEAILISLWCHILDRDWKQAELVQRSAADLLKKQNQSPPQKEELQYLLAVLASGTGA